MTYTARTKRWEKGWEIHLDDVGLTQTRTLTGAAQQAADLIASYLDVEVTTEDVDLVIDLGGDLNDQVAKARAMVREAERLQLEAASESRRIARTLRSEGLSVTDAAAVLGVSRGRVSQLVGGSS